MQQVALERLAADPSLDLYIFGHSHAQAMGRAERSGGTYANPGAFLDAPTFLRVIAERVELVQVDGAALQVLETLERRDPS